MNTAIKHRWMRGTWELSPTSVDVLDDFNRTDGNIRNGAGAAIWQSSGISTASAPASLISSNKLVIANSGVQSFVSVATKNSIDWDFVVELITAPTIGQFRIWGLLTKGNDANSNTGYNMQVYGPGSSVEINRVNLATTDQIGDFSGAPALTLAAGDKLAFVMRDSKLYAMHWRSSLGWRVMRKIANVDTTFTSGSFGIERINTDSFQIDNLILGVPGPDVVAPTVSFDSLTLSKISRVNGKDATIVNFTTNEAFVEYELRKVGNETDTRAMGTQIETATVTSRTSHSIEITDDELVAAGAAEGSNLLKLFVKDASGNWST